jgi:hypothetical protein
MTPSRQLEVKMKEKYFSDRKMNLLEVHIKYCCLVVFIRHESAEIWGFRYGLTLGIGTQKIMASTCVVVRVVFAAKHSTSFEPQTASTILT